MCRTFTKLWHCTLHGDSVAVVFAASQHSPRRGPLVIYVPYRHVGKPRHCSSQSRSFGWMLLGFRQLFGSGSRNGALPSWYLVLYGCMLATGLAARGQTGQVCVRRASKRPRASHAAAALTVATCPLCALENAVHTVAEIAPVGTVALPVPSCRHDGSASATFQRHSSSLSACRVVVRQC